MPVQMGREIAKAGDIHFFRSQCLSQGGLQREYGFHEALPVVSAEVGEFSDVLVPDDAAIAWIGFPVGTLHPDHAPLFATNNQLTTVTVAKLASGHG